MIKRVNALYHKIFYSEDLKGIALTILACFWLALMAVLIRYLSRDFAALQLVFLRNMFSVILLLPWAHGYLKRYGMSIKRLDLLFYRALSGLAGMTLFFLSLYALPTAQVTALSFTVPLVTTLMAIIFLREKVSSHFWVALIVGFIGVLIILKPGTDMFQISGLLVIAATFFWSVSNILVKKLSDIHSPNVVVFVVMCILSIISLPGALIQWQDFNPEKLVWVFALAWVTTQAQIAISKSYKHTDVKTLMPFDFTRLVFVSIFAYIWFGEVVDIATYIGATLITLSAIYVVYKVTKRGAVVQMGKGKIINRL